MMNDVTDNWWQLIGDADDDADKGLFINDVIIFRGYADPPLPLVISRHFSATPLPPLCDDVIYERPRGGPERIMLHPSNEATSI